jgi:putative acetyltransferase
MAVIRAETPADYDAVHEVNVSAFERDSEAKLVAAIRQSDDFIPELSLVAVSDAKIAGHILFSRVHIQTPSANVAALALAPLAVLPDYQNQGIGSALVQYGLQEARRLGHKIAIVLGHPNYYPRFGFVPSVQFCITSPFPVADEVFMVQELVPGALVGINGMVKYPPTFDNI